MKIDKTKLGVELLRGRVQAIYEKTNVDMRLFQPGIEPLSVIDKSKEEIICELKVNIIKIFEGFSKSNYIPLNNEECLKLFGTDNEELKKLSERILSSYHVVKCSINDEEFSNDPAVQCIQKYFNEKTDEICNRMLSTCLIEFDMLREDYENYGTMCSNFVVKKDEAISVSVSTPQHLSKYFRIFYKDDDTCYCTIADAINSNKRKEDKGPIYQ